MKNARTIVSVLTVVLMQQFISASLRAADESLPAFHAMLDAYYEDSVALFPIDAVANGDSDPRYENVWPNEASADYRAKVAAMCDRYLGVLSKYNRAALPPGDRLSYDILKWRLTVLKQGTQQIFWLIPVNQFTGNTLTFAQFGSGAYLHPFKTPQDYRNFISRARGFSSWVDSAIANMREGVARGIVQPRVLMERVLPQLEPLMSDDPAKNVFYGPLVKLPADLSAGEKSKLEMEYREGIRTVIIPAYARLYAFIKEDYLAHCRDTAGIGEVPGGAEAYAYSIRLLTTTDMTADEIHSLGLREVTRIRAEMEKIKTKVGFKGSLPEFLKFVGNDPQFAPFKTDEEVLNAYRAIESRVMVSIPKFFAHVPRTKFEIRATEKFRAESASVEYVSGASDGSRPGIFYVPIVTPDNIRTPRMEDFFLHEAIPGHHFQISLTLENTSLPKFRRYEVNNAYAEGWGLYAESLGRELGMLTDPYEYFGMLLLDMHRAVRLVVDTGIHAKGWSREKALAYADEQEGSSPSKQYETAEIERYMAWPGQALGYKVGQLKILELRALAQKELGSKFDIRAFHDEVLSEGALPLAVLETRIKDWIAQSAAK